MRSELRRAVLAICLLSLALSEAASAFTFDFESQPVDTSQDGSLTSLTMTDSGLTVVITRSSGAAFDVLDATAGGYPDAYPASWGDQALSPMANSSANDFFIATFSELVFSVTLEGGDFGVDSDVFTLEAFSGEGGTGLSLDFASVSWGLNDFGLLGPGDPPAVLTVSSGEGFRSIEFRGGSTSFPNSLYYDNLVVMIPEPSPALMVGLGLLGLAARRRRAP